ncbi:MAG: PilZ domain-containing protein [Chitinispirillia bacterium]|nr:PilZ domain-containing protein [Chitinispirillia bacterium]MCL2268957.1 PilZ domain-containing protein [Chitinispirillia bacterium]
MNMRNRKLTAALLCLVPLAPAFAQVAVPRGHEIADRFRLVTASPAVIAGLAAIFCALFGILVSVYLNSRRKHRLTAQEASAKLFNEECARCELSRGEADTLRALCAFVPQSATESHRIFDTPVMFERALEGFVSQQLRAGRGETLDDVLRTLRRKLGYSTLASDMPLLSTRNIGVGQMVSISAPGQSLHPRGGRITRVGEYSFTVRFTDDMAGSTGAAGSQVTISFLRQGDAAYSVPTTISSAGDGTFNALHVIKFARSQNRKHMRLEVSMPISYRVAAFSDPTNGPPPPDALKARTVDISGGGMCFIAEAPLHMGDEILISLQIPGYSMGGIRARIIKVIAIEGKAAKQYKHLSQFTVIEPQQRERIVKFIFEKQRETLQMR